ncbi:MAG TPA: hypothetical protein VEZ50_13640 [Nodosilinea sp.]|nr:hypothetical protein [Nodosilinea sp.]
MFENFRLRFFPANFYGELANGCQKLGASFRATLMVGLLATVLWLGAAGTYTQPAQAGDNLDARPYEAEAVRQSRNPDSHSNYPGGVDPSMAARGEAASAPEDQANQVLENVKDAVQNILPGGSGDGNEGQNAYNPNTPNSH